MNYRLIISSEAEFDIEDAFKWYEESSSGLGSEFVRAVDGCFALIGRNHDGLSQSISASTTGIDTPFSLWSNVCCGRRCHYYNRLFSR